jgi:hypothetical protein
MGVHHHYSFFTSPISNLKDGYKRKQIWVPLDSLFNSSSSSSFQSQLNVFQYYFFRVVVDEDDD